MRDAEACGCFAPPDPTVPIVQAGERIAFEMDAGVVTAHIQVQYSGPAQEFGWLLPLPADPEMKLGTDELFAQLIATTQPKYRVNREYEGNCPFDPNQAFPPFAGSDSAEDGDGGDTGPLVRQDSIGPYDYAILRADDKNEMFQWLTDNRFFIPVGTDDAVGPYIRPGAFFLALKLRKGNDVGDLQPVVVKYASDLPMIPIVLTSVAADPNMGVMVWVLGEHRAIPRNYYHTVLNDASLDWLNFGANYVDVLTRAVDESPEHRSFVTEYAATSSVMVDLLDYQGRFGDLNQLRQITDPVAYVNFLNWNGFAVFTNQPPFFGSAFTSGTLAVLADHLPVPAGLLAAGITPNDYYTSFEYYVTQYSQFYPELFTDLDLVYDPIELTTDLEERVVTPTLEAGAMFRSNPMMTRLFTTLSPEEMTRDPVFSFNPDLPEVSNIHDSRLIFRCGIGGDDIALEPATLITEYGFELQLPSGTGTNPWLNTWMPASLRTEILREEGAPRVVTDNYSTIATTIEGGQASGGCQVGAGAPASRDWAALALLGIPLVVVMRRRSRAR